MIEDVCYGWLCFGPPVSPDGASIFGFAEFLTALALLVVIYTIADIRYKFRLSIAPLALYPITFGVIALVGIQTLVNDVWFAEGWWVLRTGRVSRWAWQGIFGALFLGTFLTWMYFAFIRAPVFGKRNAKRFANNLYRLILKGNDAELAIIANELARSANSLVLLSRRIAPRVLDEQKAEETKKTKKRKPGAGDYAHDILLLIGNRKLCRHIAESSPVTALAFFDAMSRARKYDIPIGQFAKAISAEAIRNTDSILYHEGDGFTSGLLGYLKPWSQTIYGNFELIEALAANLGSPLDVDYRDASSWDAEQWNAYCRATLAALGGYLKSSRANTHSYALVRALSKIETAFIDTYKLNGAEELHKDDAYLRLEVAVQFVKDAAELIDEQAEPPETQLRRRTSEFRRDLYDRFAALMFDIVFAAARVSGPRETCWTIHYGTVWSEFFTFNDESHTWKILRMKLRRLLYDEIAGMTRLPNYKGARILGLVLNVAGTKVGAGLSGHGRSYRALAKAVQAWTRRNYLRLRAELPDVAEAVLIGDITYDEAGQRIVKTYAKGLSKEAPRHYLDLDAPSPPSTAV